ncbi:hypothetical protein AXF41_01810 [Clostridium haemolyticum]|uniref:DUF1788 domain-containing protein n=1 Tax=Clostridium haemolyticum TaxID=84025 RepID=UPI0009CAF211|nr:DUF1788 domain-containing protein [Clostridium haemolyticum]OOB75060.1 hypothetical protein AXF41_01810 [Clostridium haemolyticum]
MEKVSLGNRLERIANELNSENFVKGKGLGNEISYYVFDYDPKEELMVREYIKHIIKEFNKINSNRKIIEFDLYKMLIGFLKQEGDFQQIIDLENREGKEYILEAVATFVNSDIYCEMIQEMSEGFDIIFLTGIGKVYPFMRSHNILNNLQQYLKKKPLVMFYPGEYSGQDLKLFKKFKDENYYRAFPLV